MRDEVVQAGMVFVDPAACADEKRFHDACTLLRAEDPIHFVEADGFDPFWIISKHRDVFAVENHPSSFLSGPRPMLAPKPERRAAGDAIRVSALVNTDGAEHLKLRAVTGDWFHPKNLAKLQPVLARVAREYVDLMAASGGACDFVAKVSTPFPLAVICSMLGIPSSEIGPLRRFSDGFASADEEPLESEIAEDDEEYDFDHDAYFSELAEERRKHPTDDLASTIANGKIDGVPLGALETISYFVLMVTAGHSTVGATMAGGLELLLRNPDQLRKLQSQPELIPSAVEEMIRWVTPVKHFIRTATEDYALSSRTIPKGDAVLISYPSANRDEDVFSNPFNFDVARTPNRHLAFGAGPHYCLGVHLARMELRALFAELLPRLRSIDYDGAPIERKSIFLGGLRTLPIRYNLGDP